VEVERAAVGPSEVHAVRVVREHLLAVHLLHLLVLPAGPTARIRGPVSWLESSVRHGLLAQVLLEPLRVGRAHARWRAELESVLVDGAGHVVLIVHRDAEGVAEYGRHQVQVQGLQLGPLLANVGALALGRVIIVERHWRRSRTQVTGAWGGRGSKRRARGLRSL